MPIEGLLVVDKPAGPTSHDIVAEVRRFASGARVGHTGTLDPFATGVLPLCIGRATRLARFLTATRKVYSGLVRLGVATDTYDADGSVISRRDASGIGARAVREAAARFVGTTLQTPPVYSARKQGGEPLYRLARAGREVSPGATPITVYRFDILGVEGDAVSFEAETSPGTYVRAIANDLGRSLGCGAHLASLRRIASGRLTVRQAISMEEVRERGREGRIAEVTIPLSSIDLGLPTLVVTPEGRAAMSHGRALSPRDLALPADVAAAGEAAPAMAFRVQDEAGALIGVAVRAVDPRGAPLLRPDVVLVA